MEDMDISISRAFNHYGPRQRPEFLIPSIMLRLLRSQTLEMGNPNPTRDFTYVTDIINGYVLLGERGKSSEIYHFSSGEERSVREIVETIVNISSTNPTIHWNPDARRVDIARSLGDSSKARKALGWNPTVSFEEGIKTTLDWYRSHQVVEA
jgi:nucleoside-diphosphate-sugar epimerase